MEKRNITISYLHSDFLKKNFFLMFIDSIFSAYHTCREHFRNPTTYLFCFKTGFSGKLIITWKTARCSQQEVSCPEDLKKSKMVNLGGFPNYCVGPWYPLFFCMNYQKINDIHMKYKYINILKKPG